MFFPVRYLCALTRREVAPHRAVLIFGILLGFGASCKPDSEVAYPYGVEPIEPVAMELAPGDAREMPVQLATAGDAAVPQAQAEPTGAVEPPSAVLPTTEGDTAVETAAEHVVARDDSSLPPLEPAPEVAALPVVPSPEVASPPAAVPPAETAAPFDNALGARWSASSDDESSVLQFDRGGFFDERIVRVDGTRVERNGTWRREATELVLSFRQVVRAAGESSTGVSVRLKQERVPWRLGDDGALWLGQRSYVRLQ